MGNFYDFSSYDLGYMDVYSTALEFLGEEFCIPAKTLYVYSLSSAFRHYMADAGFSRSYFFYLNNFDFNYVCFVKQFLLVSMKIVCASYSYDFKKFKALIVSENCSFNFPACSVLTFTHSQDFNRRTVTSSVVRDYTSKNSFSREFSNLVLFKSE